MQGIVKRRLGVGDGRSKFKLFAVKEGKSDRFEIIGITRIPDFAD